MNRLFGVTMAERGVSQLVSVDLDERGEDPRPERGVSVLPLPCGEGRRDERSSRREALEEDPSPGSRFVATLSRKGRGDESQMPPLCPLNSSRPRRQAGRPVAHDAAARAAAISKTYRDGGNSGAITSETDALAYALARMPATYAAVAASLERAGRDRPDFAPQSLLDVGAGPGTASWAAAEAFTVARKLRAARCQSGACVRWRWISLRGSPRLGAASYELGQARALARRSR